jgi:hypothetical protein
MFKNFFRKSWLLRDNIEKYGRVRKVRGDNITQRMNLIRCVTKVKNTHSICYLFLLEGNNV